MYYLDIGIGQASLMDTADAQALVAGAIEVPSDKETSKADY